MFPGKTTRLYLLIAICSAFGSFASAQESSTAAADDPEKLAYNRDVRPILAENCFACHGPDSAARKADLRLDLRDSAIEAEAFVPGDAEDSELVFRIEVDDDTMRMPPREAKKTLSESQKATLRRWVEEGAEYQPHWSFLAPTRPQLPELNDETWPRNPVDRFILAEQESAGLEPAPEADRHALIRRVTLDLTGLPPTPGEVDSYINDKSPDAYERLVDRLLASPRYGEAKARPWLDAARYADTHGLHFDNYREMWTYRDYVIDAFNRDLPFDQFTLEQLAGDLLPDPTLRQQIASGFNRNLMTTNEGGTILEENLVGYTRDRTETFSQVWLGMTAGCAVCHDHKFDPLSQREFYELAAFFNNTSQAALDGNVSDTPPTIVVPVEQDRARWSQLVAELGRAREGLENRKAEARPDFDAWLAGSDSSSVKQLDISEGRRLRASLADRFGEQPEPTAPGSLEIADLGDFEKDQAFAASAWVRPAKGDASGAIVARMEAPEHYRGWDFWLEAGRPAMHIIHSWPEVAIKVKAVDPIEPNRWSHVTAAYDGSGKAAGISIYVDGVAVPTKVDADSLTGSIRVEVPLTVGRRSASSPLSNAAVHDLQIHGRAMSKAEAFKLAGAGLLREIVAMSAEARPESEVDRLYGWWLAAVDTRTIDLRANLANLEVEAASIQDRGTIAYVMHEQDEEAEAYVLFRGDYDKRRDRVTAETPAILPPMASDLPKNRLGLARWLLSDEHPLTARVTVNRTWQEFFGTGLVRTAGDFGATGEPPSHPELLDWLAVEFRDGGWDVKALDRLLVTSATYRQSAAGSDKSRELDPDNRLLARAPRDRLPAETIRDNALAASGLLVEKLGGPSVRPYQPGGVWESVAMPESNTRKYVRDEGRRLYRRSLYTFWKRAAPPASMETLDAPNREVCTVRRERTNTPLQALVTLNDTQFVEAARVLAASVLESDAKADADRFDRIARRLLARSFGEAERSIVAGSLDGLRGYYRDHPEDAEALVAVGESPEGRDLDPSELAAWTMLANELMNLDEVLCK